MADENLEKHLSQLIKQLEKQNSTKRNFWLSVVRGFGGALGATVVFGLGFAILFQIIKSVDYVPVLNTIFSSQALEDLIRRLTSPS